MKKQLYLFLFLAGVILLINLGNWGLTESSEARYATISKEMYESGDYVNPTLLGIKHLHKPPLTYYITTLGYQLFGVNEFGARFFLQLAFIIQLLLVFNISKLLFKNEKLAFASTLIYFSIPLAIIAVRNLTTDAYLTTFILASIYFWLKYKKDINKRWLLFFYAALGLSFLTKGPVGLIVPATFAISHILIFKNRFQNVWYHILGIVLFLVVSASWFIVVMQKNVGLFDYFFNNQLVERVAENKFKRGQPFWYYLLILPAITIPWIFFLLPYVKKNILQKIRSNKSIYVLSITFSALFIILSLSTSKLVLYILPLMFIVALLAAYGLQQSSIKRLNIYNKIYYSLILILCIAILLIKFIDKNTHINILYSLLVIMLVLILVLFLQKKIRNDNYIKTPFLGAIFSVTLLLFSTHFFGKNELVVNSVKPIAEFIKIEKPNANVMVYNYLLPSLSFYLNNQIKTINHGKYTTQRETQFETDSIWKHNLFHYATNKDRLRLQNNFNANTVLIKRKKDVLPDTLQILQKQLRSSKDLGKFTIYY